MNTSLPERAAFMASSWLPRKSSLWKMCRLKRRKLVLQGKDRRHSVGGFEGKFEGKGLKSGKSASDFAGNSFELGFFGRISAELLPTARLLVRSGALGGRAACFDLILAIKAAKDWPGTVCGTSSSLHRPHNMSFPRPIPLSAVPFILLSRQHSLGNYRLQADWRRLLGRKELQS